jgi:hypothetical protein
VIHLTRAQSAYRRSGYRLDEARVLHSLSRVRAAMGATTAADILWRRSHTILWELGVQDTEPLLGPARCTQLR